MKRSIWGCWGAENELCHWSPGWCQPSPQAHEPSRCLPAQGRGIRKNWKKKHITVCVCRIPQKLTWSNSLTLYPSLSLCIRARFAHSWRVWRVKVTLISQCCSIARSELICKLSRFGVNCCQDRLCRILRAKESVDIKVDQANWTNSRCCNLWVKTFLFDIWHWWIATHCVFRCI